MLGGLDCEKGESSSKIQGTGPNIHADMIKTRKRSKKNKAVFVPYVYTEETNFPDKKLKGKMDEEELINPFEYGHAPQTILVGKKIIKEKYVPKKVVNQKVAKTVFIKPTSHPETSKVIEKVKSPPPKKVSFINLQHCHVCNGLGHVAAECLLRFTPNAKGAHNSKVKQVWIPKRN